MSERGHKVQKLATQVLAGATTYELIADEFGDDMVSSVMALIASGGVSSVVGDVYDVARDVPIVGDVLDVGADVIDDIFDLF